MFHSNSILTSLQYGSMSDFLVANLLQYVCSVVLYAVSLLLLSLIIGQLTEGVLDSVIGKEISIDSSGFY